jgi:hypothetical protein
MDTGWRLPTKEELTILNDNMDVIGGFDPSAWYWSSTELSNTSAWFRPFSDCYEGYSSKSSDHRVRCARSESFNNLIISKNASIGERFDLDGEEVVLAGTDENGLALIVAAQDEPNLMNWSDALQAAQDRNQRQV